MASNISPPCQIARVARVDEAGQMWVQYPNGLISSITVTNSNLEPGSIVLLDMNSGHIEEAPTDLWHEDRAVGIVHRRTDDETLVECGGRLILLPTTSTSYDVGNTVEWGPHAGVQRVLDLRPLSPRDEPGLDHALIADFRRDPDPHGLDFSDFGGLPEVVERAKQLIEVQMTYHNELNVIKARPIKGVLFTGLPGTGKTLLAQIIANRAGATFYEIRGPEVFSKWVGESEMLIRKLFEDAAEQDRSIVFFDEIDSIASRRDDNSHEVSRRVVAQLLTALDGFTKKTNVVVIATTNRRDDIDRALLRPGRFDWEVEFPLPNREDRADILRVGAARLTTAEQLPHAFVAEQTDGWPPAELAAIWSEAALFAVMDGGRKIIMAEDYLRGFERRRTERKRKIQDAEQQSEEGT